jgi:hypothetical protein
MMIRGLRIAFVVILNMNMLRSDIESHVLMMNFDILDSDRADLKNLFYLFYVDDF